MPYIENKSGIREVLLDGQISPRNVGELNYLITRLCHTYIERHGLSYATCNDVTGVLECAKMELYRMVAAPYEDKKKRENGSVSELDATNLEEVR